MLAIARTRASLSSWILRSCQSVIRIGCGQLARYEWWGHVARTRCQKTWLEQSFLSHSYYWIGFYGRHWDAAITTSRKANLLQRLCLELHLQFIKFSKEGRYWNCSKSYLDNQSMLFHLVVHGAIEYDEMGPWSGKVLEAPVLARPLPSLPPILDLICRSFHQSNETPSLPPCVSYNVLRNTIHMHPSGFQLLALDWNPRTIHFERTGVTTNDENRLINLPGDNYLWGRLVLDLNRVHWQLYCTYVWIHPAEFSFYVEGSIVSTVY